MCIRAAIVGGATPVPAATHTRPVDATKLLREAGADVNMQARDGSSPLAGENCAGGRYGVPSNTSRRPCRRC